MSKSRGYRHKSRKVFRKRARERGLSPLGRILRDYKVGEKVVICIDPSVHKGMPHRRFHGRVGTVVEKRGRAYCVTVIEGGKAKLVIARPEHLKPL